MVVPSNRRGFLATLRNVAILAGISSPAIASPIAQSSGNSEGLPVILFDKQHKLLLPDGIEFNPKFKIENPWESVDTQSCCFVGACYVWVPPTTPIVYRGENNDEYSQMAHGKMILGKWSWRNNKTEWVMLVPCELSTKGFLNNRFRSMDSIRMAGKEF